MAIGPYVGNQRNANAPSSLPYMTPSVGSSKLLENIPIEIWTNIFFIALADNTSLDDNPPPPIFSERYTLLAIGFVGKYWRKIILNNPQFWTTVYVVMSMSNAQNVLGHVKFLEEWVSRARNLPLSIKITEGYSLANSSAGPREPLCDFVKKHSAHWRSLDIYFSAIIARIDYSEVLHLGEFPELRSLILRAASKDQFRPPRVAISAPKLHQFHTMGRVIFVSESMTPGQWNRINFAPYPTIKKAKVHEHHILDFVMMFAPRLVKESEPEEVEVKEIVYTNLGEPGAYSPSFVHVPITLHRLSSFTARLGSPSNCQWLLSHMDCPALATLDLTLERGIGSGPRLASIGAFMAHKAPKLKVLRLSCFDVDEGELIDMLEIGGGCLKEFRLTHRGSNSFISNATLKRMKPDSNPISILRHLSVFYYRGRTKDLDLRQIAETIRSREMQEFTFISSPIDEVVEDQGALNQLKRLAIYQNQVSRLHIEVHKKVIVTSESNK